MHSLQLGVLFSAGSESISFSLSVRAQGYGVAVANEFRTAAPRKRAAFGHSAPQPHQRPHMQPAKKTGLDFENRSANSQQRALTAERADSDESARTRPELDRPLLAR